MCLSPKAKKGKLREEKLPQTRPFIISKSIFDKLEKNHFKPKAKAQNLRNQIKKHKKTRETRKYA